MEIKSKIDFLRKNKLNIVYQILKILVCFVLMYAINNVKIFDSINVFGFSFSFALIWSGYNPLLVGGIFALTFCLSNMTLVSIKMGCVVLIVCIILYIWGKMSKISYRYALPYILCVITLIPYIYWNWGDAKRNFTLLIACLFTIFFLYVCKYFFKGTIKRGFNTRLNTDEKVCGAIILMLIAYGVASIELFGIDWVVLISAIFTLVATYTFDSIFAIVISFVFGLGASLYTFNPLYVAYLVSFGVFSVAFKSNIKLFSSLSIIIAYLVFTLYFSEFFIFDTSTLISLIVVCLVFCFIPNRLIRYIKDIFAGSKNNLAVRNVVKVSKEKIARRLSNISKVFKEMEFSFKRTLQKTLPISEKKELIKQDIVSSVCKDCVNYNKCMRINGDYTTQIFDSLVDAGVTKGRVEKMDLNSYISYRCPKIPYLLSSTNEIIKAYREYNILANNMDCSKVLVAEQFKGVSILMQGLAEEVKDDISFDTDLETRIAEDLLYKNIFVEEVVVYDKGVNDREILLMVRNNKIDKNIIEKLVSKACKCKIKIVSVEPSEIPNVSVVHIVTCPNFDIVFGSATCNKSGTIVSGDTHSFVKIDNGKYMIALSDGMGSGTKARETSDLSISLIENYYKAGFDNALILSSVNKLLSLNNEESFSATDLCIFDFFNNTMDFVKLGTPNSFIKRKTGVEIVQSSGLPIGILEEIRPHITKKYITNFDIVVMVSDGISDAFAKTNLQVFINNLNMINPQQIADSILSQAKLLSKGVFEDDMTVLVARIFATN